MLLPIFIIVGADVSFHDVDNYHVCLVDAVVRGKRDHVCVVDADVGISVLLA